MEINVIAIKIYFDSKTDGYYYSLNGGNLVLIGDADALAAFWQYLVKLIPELPSVPEIYPLSGLGL